MKKVNMKTVAKEADVSTATVSRVIGKYPGVRDKTKKRVLKTIEKLNYEKNAVASNLRRKKTNTIGIIIGNVLSQFYSIIAKSVEVFARENNYSVILCNSDDNPEKEIEYLRILKANRVDGIILTPTGKNVDYINRLLESEIKMVLIDRLIDKVNCDALLIENESSSYNAVKFLIDRGYKKIAIINGYIDRTTGKERLNGYIRALAKSNISVNNNFIKIGSFKKRCGIKMTKELLDETEKPEAIFCANLDITLGTLAALKEERLKVPNDIGIVGFDDSEVANLMDITVVKQPVREIGTSAAELLIKKIENNLSQKERPLITRLTTKLIVRNSTK